MQTTVRRSCSNTLDLSFGWQSADSRHPGLALEKAQTLVLNAKAGRLLGERAHCGPEPSTASMLRLHVKGQRNLQHQDIRFVLDLDRHWPRDSRM